jgi:hypothetical protein
MVAKEDWPVETNKVLDQIHTSSERLGKQHIGYTLSLQSIAREFFESAKSISRRIQDIELKVWSPF